jgi:hypothetical protein
VSFFCVVLRRSRSILSFPYVLQLCRSITSFSYVVLSSRSAASLSSVLPSCRQLCHPVLSFHRVVPPRHSTTSFRCVLFPPVRAIRLCRFCRAWECWHSLVSGYLKRSASRGDILRWNLTRKMIAIHVVGVQHAHEVDSHKVYT